MLKGTEFEGQGVCDNLNAHLINNDLDEFTKSDSIIFYDIAGFEDFIKSMFTVFTVITLEGWSLMMMNYFDGGEYIVSPIFFILVVILGAFFALNLVLAEVMESFERSKETEESNEDDELDSEKKESTAANFQQDEEVEEVEHSGRDLIKVEYKEEPGSEDPDSPPAKELKLKEESDGSNLDVSPDALSIQKMQSEKFENEEVQDKAARKRSE